MGPTGSGKSRVSFILLDHAMSANCPQQIIDILTGQNMRAGTGSEIVTNEITAHRVLRHAKYRDKLVLVDTPGFDNTHKGDTQTLKMVSEWLAKTYVEVSPRNGILIKFSNLPC